MFVIHGQLLNTGGIGDVLPPMETDKPGRIMSNESGARFEECLVALRKTHQVFSTESGGATADVFDAVRLYMVAAAVYVVWSGMEGTDEDIRTVLHDLLELAIDDYQFNERLHVGSKEAS